MMFRYDEPIFVSHLAVFCQIVDGDIVFKDPTIHKHLAMPTFTKDEKNVVFKRKHYPILEVLHQLMYQHCEYDHAEARLLDINKGFVDGNIELSYKLANGDTQTKIIKGEKDYAPYI